MERKIFMDAMKELQEKINRTIENEERCMPEFFNPYIAEDVARYLADGCDKMRNLVSMEIMNRKRCITVDRD